MPVDRVLLVFPQQYKHPKHSKPTCIEGAIRDFSLLDFGGGAYVATYVHKAVVSLHLGYSSKQTELIANDSTAC